MKIASVELLWPYPPGSGRPVEQMDVLVDLDDGSRWMSSFYDTHRFNRGVKGFRGIADQEFRFQARMIIVRELTEETVRRTVEALLESGDFEQAFERVGDPSAETGD